MMVSPTVLKKLEAVEEYRTLSRAERQQKADLLTSPAKIWEIYFSGAVLDPARDEIEAGLQAAQPLLMESRSRGKVTVKVEMEPVINSGNYGLQGQVTSLLLRNYGSLHASLLVADAVLLEWNAASLVIPTGKPIIEAQADSAGRVEPMDMLDSSTMSTIIEQEFEATVAKKAFVDRIIEVVTRYNKLWEYDPIQRNCQAFVADVLKELKYKLPQGLEGNLAPYYKQLKESQAKKCKTLSSHAELDTYVQECLERELQTQTMEYLLVQYFRFHVTSLASCANPKRWACSHPDCLMHRLEQRINRTDTLAHQLLH